MMSSLIARYCTRFDKDKYIDLKVIMKGGYKNAHTQLEDVFLTRDHK